MKKCSYTKYGAGETTPPSDQDKLNTRLIEYLQMDTLKLEPIKELLEKGANPNIKHPYVYPFTTITNMLNLKNGKEVLELLLKYGLDPNLQDTHSTRDSLLHFTVKLNLFDIVQLLVTYHAKVNSGNKADETPLIYAIKKKNVKMVEYLLQHGADPNSIYDSGIISLHLAAVNNLQDIVEILLKFGANPNIMDKNNHTPLTYAIIKKHTDMIQMLLPKCDIDTLENGIEQAAANRDLNILKILIQDDLFHDLYDNEEVLLRIGSSIIENFLQTLSDIDIEIITWLISYIGSGIFRTILENQPYILTELMYIYSSDVNKIGFLINLGASAGSVNPQTGNTSLIVSAKNTYTNIDVVKCLVNHVKDKPKFINKENREGETALILFANSSDNIIKYLIENGGDINYKNKLGETFFMHACKSSFDISYLITKGADIDNQSKIGETALMWAIKDENDTKVKILLDKNANILLETRDNKNALDIAIEINNSIILRLLSQHIINNRDIEPRQSTRSKVKRWLDYNKIIAKYTTENRLKWKDACKIKDTQDIDKYKEVFKIESDNEQDICSKLDEKEQQFMDTKNKVINQCINSEDLDGNDIEDIYPENFYSYEQNGVTYCEDIRTLFKLLKSFKKRQPPKPLENPYTGKVLPDTIIQDIEDKYKLYNIISTGKQIEEKIITPTTPRSKDILLTQLSFFYNIMKNLSSKDIFLSAPSSQIDSFLKDLLSLSINSTSLFSISDLEKLKNDDLDKYKYQLIQFLLSKAIADKYKYTEGELIIYPTRDAIQNTWNKIFK
jgi:ankyrin repeat protein